MARVGSSNLPTIEQCLADERKWELRIRGCDERARKAEAEAMKLEQARNNAVAQQERWLREKREALALAANGGA